MRHHAAVRFALISGALALLTRVTSGCAEEDASASQVTIAEFICRSETERAVTTAPWPDRARLTEGCPWLSFPEQRTLRIFHEMNAAPVAVLPYIAFTPDGIGGTLAVGDLLTIERVDDQELVVRNNTNQLFYLRLVLLKE